MATEIRKYTCCICGKKFTGWGNNPWPVVKDENADCCDDCNISIVLEARLNQLLEVETDEG